MNLSLLLVIDRDIPSQNEAHEDPDFYLTTLYLIKEGQLIPIDLQAIGRYCAIQDKLFPANMPSRFIKEDELRRKLNMQAGFDFTEVICTVPVTLNILINSPGGNKAVLDYIVNLIRFTKHRGGIVNSFSFLHVASAAAHIFAGSNNRYCFTITEFVCHSPYIPAGIEINEEEDVRLYVDKLMKDIKISEYKNHLVEFFEGRKKTFDVEINGIIENALQNPDTDLILKGTMLEYWGVVNKCYRAFDEFATLIKTNIGVIPASKNRLHVFLEEMKQTYEKVYGKRLRAGIIRVINGGKRTSKSKRT